MVIPFQFGLEVVQRLEAWFFEFPYPARVHLVDGNGVEIMQFFPSPPFDGDKIRFFEQPKVLCDRLSCHIEARAQFNQCLAAAFVQAVNQDPSAGVRESFEHFIDLFHGLTIKGGRLSACW
jgi:hypothetical protein